MINILNKRVFKDYGYRFGIVTPKQQILFASQIMAEIRDENHLEESFKYSYDRFKAVFGARKAKLARRFIRTQNYKQIANIAYNGKLGNRKNSNDGWDYRGMGFIQLTGRINYLNANRELIKRIGINFDLLKNPELLKTPDIGLLSSMAFWSMNKIYEKTTPDECTDIVNKHTDSRRKREAFYNEMMEEFHNSLENLI